MRLHIPYTFRFDKQLPTNVRIPYTFENKGMVLEISDIDEARRHANGFVEGPVDIAELKLVHYYPHLDGTVEPPGIEVKEISDLHAFADVVSNSIALLLDLTVDASRKFLEDYLIPETGADEEILAKFGTTELFRPLYVSLHQRAIYTTKLTSENISKLIGKEVGLAIYAQSRRIREPIGEFRELWKVLESAFGRKDRNLIDLLVQYEPLMVTGLGRVVFQNLHTVRGRASHAESRAGIREYRNVNHLVSEHLQSLRQIVEEVLITKVNWGSADLQFERLDSIDDYTPFLFD